MRVACIVVSHFMVEVERLQESSLRRRPVIVGGAPEERKEVLDCSVEAMARGVRPGMTLREALGRCGEGAFVEAHPDRYREVTLAMVSALREISPLVEPAGPGVIYLGVDGQVWDRGTGRRGDHGKTPRPPIPPSPHLPVTLSLLDPLEADLARTIVAAAEQASGLQVRLGMADGKFAAYAAAVMADGAQRPEAAS